MFILKKSQINYPKLLMELHKPPEKLFCKGVLELFDKPSIAIVGTRRYSDYGKAATQKIIQELSLIDINIVSGLAKGIDTIAHKAALENGLSTIAVLGSGLEQVYPRENRSLAKEIATKGLLISEYPPDSPPEKYHFPQRNRIISGLCLATVVIEAPIKSGALITADFALDQGRDIFVVPGDIDRPNSQGIFNLLQRGVACPISSGKELMQRLNLIPTKSPQNTLTNISDLKIGEKEAIVLAQLSKYRARSIEDISKKVPLHTSEILGFLSLLEIRELVENRAGKYLRLI
jgi:DNA processing protein